MPYQPTLPSPYMTSIDASIDNVFRCLINPRDRIDLYDFSIKNSKGEEVYLQKHKANGVSDTSYTIDERLPFYGTPDNNSWLEIEVPLINPADGEATLINGRDYSWSIKLYHQYTYIADNHLQPSEVSTTNSILSPDYFFTTRTAPKITFSISEDEVISSSVLDVSVNYKSSPLHCTSSSKKEAPSVSYYCFNLYLDAQLVHTTGNIISSNIRYYYDGLISGKQYELELIIVDDEKTRTVVSRKFSVEYKNHSTPVIPEVAADYTKNCIDVDFGKNVVIKGNLEGDQTVVLSSYGSASSNTNGISLNSKQNLYWNERAEDVPLDLDNTVQIINWHGHEGFCGVIFEKTDKDNSLKNIVVRYDGTAFYYKFGTQAEVMVNNCYALNGGSISDYVLYGGDTGALTFESAICSDYSSPTEDNVKTAYSGIDESLCYILNDENEISDTDIILSNDMTYKYWWVIVVLENEVKFYRGQKFNAEVS